MENLNPVDIGIYILAFLSGFIALGGIMILILKIWENGRNRSLVILVS